jgi:3-phenylpropionate/cinnamic acid dioxygenase small subunit
MGSDRAIENLIAQYAFLVDDGDFEGLGRLLAHCNFTLGAGPPVRGDGAVTALATHALQVHADGTPRTRHVTSNLLIEIDEDAGKATARAYYTVFQAVDDFPLQAIASGTYSDCFERHDGIWRFAARTVTTRFSGDTSRHRRTTSG